SSNTTGPTAENPSAPACTSSRWAPGPRADCTDAGMRSAGRSNRSPVGVDRSATVHWSLGYGRAQDRTAAGAHVRPLVPAGDGTGPSGGGGAVHAPTTAADTTAITNPPRFALPRMPRG